MDRLTSLALIGFLGSAALACGDDDDDSPRPGNTGGTASGGNGSGGTSTGGSSMGNAGNGMGNGGNGGTPGGFAGIATCSQCVEVEVPVSGANSADNVTDQVGFPFFFGAPGQDFSNVTVIWRVMALENNPDLMVAPYAENGDPYPGAYGAHIALSEENFPPGEWVDVYFDLSRVPLPAALPDGGLPDAGGDGVAGADAGAPVDAGPLDASVELDDGDPAASDFLLLEPAFDKRLVEQLGIYVGSRTTLVGDAVAKVAIDEVRFEGTPERADVTFATGLENFMLNTFNMPPGTQGPLWHQ